MLLYAHSRIQQVTKKSSVIDGLGVDRDDYESAIVKEQEDVAERLPENDWVLFTSLGAVLIPSLCHEQRHENCYSMDAAYMHSSLLQPLEL
jgi:hypothetical protein